MPGASSQASDLAALQARYVSFVDRLIVRGGELVAETLPQLRQLARSDQAGTTGRVLSAVHSQLYGLEAKAREVYDQQIADLDDDDDGLADGVRSACTAQDEHLSALVERWTSQLERAAEPDYEAEYRRIVAEFEATAGSYRCQQCGASLPIDRIFFIDVYVTCPQCQTQNRYSPPLSARSLDAIALPFAKQRHARFVDANLAVEDQSEALRRRWYDIRMPAEFGDRAAKAEMVRLCEQMMALLHQFDHNTQAYLAAVYTDVQAMVPDKAAHYQKLYADALRYHHKEVADEATSITTMLNEARR